MYADGYLSCTWPLIFSPHQTGFPNGINALHCPILIIKNLKKAIKIDKKLLILEITLCH